MLVTERTTDASSATASPCFPRAATNPSRTSSPRLPSARVSSTRNVVLASSPEKTAFGRGRAAQPIAIRLAKIRTKPPIHDRLASRGDASVRNGRFFLPFAMAEGLAPLVGADLGRTMLALHPHEYVYFNRLIGGLGGAVGNYDTDYYGQSYKEAVEGMHRFLWRTERRQYMNTIYTFSACMSNWAVARHAPPNLRGHRQKTGPGPDFHAGYHRYHCDQRHPGAPVVFRVEREGGELAVVKDLRPLKAAAAANRSEEPRP